MMTRKTPNTKLAGRPCLVTALRCAMKGKTPVGEPALKEGGYATLASADKWIRANLPVEKRINFRRGERPLLKNLHFDGQAVVCVLGHYIYLEGETYWSFFSNRNDEVVTLWKIRR